MSHLHSPSASTSLREVAISPVSVRENLNECVLNTINFLNSFLEVTLVRVIQRK